MPNDYFRFKQFTVYHDRCAMKVGTDGVLLGAWAEGGMRILDIGTGTGLIALMMAQRFQQATVTGIDIDTAACRQAWENAKASPFADRVEIQETSVQSYMPSEAFDAIVSNPPFFVNSLRNPDKRRAVARHTGTLSYRELFAHAYRLLTAVGVFSIIVPTEMWEDVLSESSIVGFSLSKVCAVKTVESRPPKRYLLTFSKEIPEKINSERLLLMGGAGYKSDEYNLLTKDFYL